MGRRVCEIAQPDGSAHARIPGECLGSPKIRGPTGRFPCVRNGDASTKVVHSMQYDDNQPETGPTGTDVMTAWVLAFILLAGLIAASFA